MGCVLKNNGICVLSTQGKSINAAVVRTLSGLTSIEICGDIETVLYGAFSGITSITDVTINTNNKVSLEARSFKGCTNLSNVYDPNNKLKNVDESAFDLTSIESISWGNIHHCSRPFSACSELTSVSIQGDGDSIVSIGSRNSGLTSVSFGNGVLIAIGSEFSKELSNVHFGNNVTGVGGFRQCSALTSVSLPSSVVGIHGDAFYGASNFSNVNLPSNIKYINGNAFAMTNLSSANIPEGCITVGYRAFYMSSLSTIKIPQSVRYIGEEAFYGTNLTTVKANARYIGNYAFGYSNVKNLYLDCTNSKGCGGDTYVGTGILAQGPSAGSFTYSSIVIKGYRTIMNIFEGYGGEKPYPSGSTGNSIEIEGDGQTTVYFSGPYYFNNIVFGDGVVSANTGTFAKTVVFGKDVVDVGFVYGSPDDPHPEVKDIYCYATVPPSEALGKGSLPNAKAHVPAASLEAYAATSWGDFGERLIGDL